MACGFAQHFGLVGVDVAPQRRIPKASARWYANLVAAERRNAVPAESGNLACALGAEG